MTEPLFSRLHVVTLTASLATLCIFVAFPGLDLTLSRLFTDGHGHFPMAASPIAQYLNDMIRIGQTTFFVVVCAIALIGRCLRLTPVSGAGNWRFVAASALIGPGLIVNGILKAGVGRARPVQIIEFGGDRIFSPILQISDQCMKNCSFSSGEVAQTATFVFVILALIWPHLPARGKAAASFAGTGLLGLSIVLRVGLGRHFMSDALASVAISAFVVLAAYRLFNVGEARQHLSGAAVREDTMALGSAVRNAVLTGASGLTRLLNAGTGRARRKPPAP